VSGPSLRSDAWLGGDDEVALNQGRPGGLRRCAAGSTIRRPLFRIDDPAAVVSVRDGDMASLRAYAGSLSVEAGLDAREPVLPMVRDRRGWPGTP